MLPILLAGSISQVPSPWMVLPFVLLLLCIASGPLAFPHWWERYYAKVAVGLGVITASYYYLMLDRIGPLIHVAEEYASFIALIGSLFIVAGGIHIRVKGQATPAVNCLFLLIGSVIANVIGTTGASMLMIRPWIRMNRLRITAFHIVFFIFIVSNVGGCLTPIGDPPLFLGFLRGVPFWWVLEHCWQAWMVGVFGLIGIFYVLDTLNFRKEPEKLREAETAHEEWRFDGLHNLGFIALILVGVFMPLGWRELIMAAAALGSWFTTKTDIHKANHFDFHPIKEVAWLFIGIFATMVPALETLTANAKTLGLNSEMQFYWGTGLLSGILDNAPTYLAFLATSFGIFGLNVDDPAHMQQFIAEHDHFLIAISIGAVFFGAMTYIGNGPNFMVKSIATHAGVKTPSFIGYITKFSLPFLIPFFFLVGILFFSRGRVF